MSSGTPVCAAICTCVSMVFSASAASAAELRWSAPEDCQTSDEVKREVDDILHQPMESVEAVDFEVEIVRTADTWQLVLRTVDRSSNERRSRELTGPSCADVTKAAAVAIAMAIQSTQHESQRADQPSLATADVPAEEKLEADAVQEQRAAERTVSGDSDGSAPESVRLSAALSVLGDWGALPAPAVGAELRASLGWRVLRLSAFGAIFAQQTQEVARGGGGEFQLVVVGVLGCAERPPNGVFVIVCAGVELDRLHARGVGISDPREGTGVWAAFLAEATAECGAMDGGPATFDAALEAEGTELVGTLVLNASQRVTVRLTQQ